MKRWMKIAIAVVVVVVVVLVALPFFVDANTFRPVLEKQLTAALGRQVKLGELSFSPFAGSLVANDLSIADDPSYSTAPFLTARQLRIGVEMKPLIFSRQLKVRSFEADAPQIHLVRAANGTWNFSSIGKNAASRTGNAQQESAFPNLTVDLIAIQDGRAVVESLPAQGKPDVYEHLNVSVRQFSFTKRFPFTLSVGLPGNGTASVTGNAGPINQQDAAMTPLDTQISVKHLDPVAAGFLDPSAGISMLADIDAHAASDGRMVNSTGTAHMQRLQLRKGGVPASKPVDLTYKVTHSLKDNTGQVQNAAIKAGNVAIQLSGTYHLAANNPSLDMKVTGQGLPIDELQALMSAAAVTLPSGSVLKGGTLTTALAVSGPVKNLVITGPVEFDNTHLVGFDLGSKLSRIAALSGTKTGDTTSIQKLRMNLRSTDAGLATSNIYALMPSLGELTGNGTVSAGGALAYRLLIKPTTAHGLGQTGVGLLAALNGRAGSTVSQIAANGVPILVGGTASNPVITADVNGLLQRNKAAILGKGQKQNLGNALRGLFGKKN